MTQDRRTFDDEDEAVDAPVTRRRWLAAGAASLAGVGLAVAHASPAAANRTGDPLLIGALGGLGDDENLSDDETQLQVSYPVGRGFAVLHCGTNSKPDLVPLTGTLLGYSSYTGIPGVRGVGTVWNGVIGQSTAVVGVVGRSTNDAGVLGESTNSIGVVGRGTSGAGVRGDSTNGNGVIGQSTNVVGVYGLSTKDAGVLGTSDLSYGVVGRSTQLTGLLGQGPAYGVRGDSAKTGVWGNSSGPGGTYAGVEGTSTNNWGVHGQSSVAAGVAGQSVSSAGVSGVSTSGPGVAASSSSGPGVNARSTSATAVVGSGAVYGAELQGTVAAVRLVPATKAGKPTTGAHKMGELYCDSAGALFFCTKAGTPGTWKKVTLT